MCDFLRVIAWFCDEKFSLKKSCFYLYIRRDTFGLWSASTTGQRWDEVSEGAVHVAKETQNGCWADIRI